MITGAHLLMYSQDAEADRDFLRDVLALPFVEAGGAGESWLIFALPPAEVGVHPTDSAPSTAMYLMCDDLGSTMRDLAAKRATFTGEPQDQGWGIVTAIALPSGAELGLYQPRHPTAHTG